MQSVTRIFTLLLASTAAIASTVGDVHASSNRTVPSELFAELEELSRLVAISYCVGYQGIQKPFSCLSHCDEFPGLELVQVCTRPSKEAQILADLSTELGHWSDHKLVRLCCAVACSSLSPAYPGGVPRHILHLQLPFRPPNLARRVHPLYYLSWPPVYQLHRSLRFHARLECDKRNDTATTEAPARRIPQLSDCVDRPQHGRGRGWYSRA